MAVYPYRKFRISLSPNSSKLQGLRIGDIVRRQYFDNQLRRNADGSYSGDNVGMIYSLMCVLDTGTNYVPQYDGEGNPVTDADGNQLDFGQPWFVGALLDGTPPAEGELLDFVRVTSLFDTDRSGALYLTASDDRAPFMDVIDGIGREKSLCWPEDICCSENPDHETQYVPQGSVTGEYVPVDGDRSRIVRLTRQPGGASFTGLVQEFYKYVSNPNMVLVSYWARASSVTRANVSLGYVNGSQTDGDVDVVIDTQWRYYFHAITVDWSGRHLRSLRMNLGSMLSGEDVWVSDLNIILLSSVADFSDASKVRVGRLDGVVDPVFGRLDGYGGYLQKLFASQSAHISGTLTAGDENGFGSSFYAGKIHKNCLINSLGLNTVGGTVLARPGDPKSPTGAGATARVGTPLSLVVQSNAWLNEKDGDGRFTHIGSEYTFSFWAYSKKPCILDISQNGMSAGASYINVLQTHTWVRIHKTFTLSELPDEIAAQDLILTVSPVFKEVTDPAFGDGFGNDSFTDPDDISDDTVVADEDVMLFSSPQLERGTLVTQYQPTDTELNYTDDYGAWFDRGGIGGTIQNPLLRLNYDGKGGIATRQNSPAEKPSLALNQDGSGHIAKGRISWDDEGDVTFDKSVKLDWDNLGDDTQHEIASKSIKILGNDTFTLLGDATGSTPVTDPADITLTIEEENLTSDSTNRRWQYLVGYEWADFPEGSNNGKELTVFPFNDDPDYWNDSNKLTVRCVVTVKGVEYTDTFTIRKQLIAGYTIEIVSSNGTGFKNNDCETVLTANVYYQGKLVAPEYCKEHYVFRWYKYDLIDGEYVEDEDFWSEHSVSPDRQQVMLDYPISGSDCFACELMLSPSFPYDFPIYF